MIQSVCLYGASSERIDPVYFEQAARLGRLLAEAGIALVYGAGKVGVMGAASRAARQSGGRTIGVIPEWLCREDLLDREADELVVTPGLRERKQAMEDRADAFVALPGGYGTLEELLEIVTLRQLGRHRKPIVILNTAGFFDPLLEMFERLRTARFAPVESTGYYRVAATAEEAVALLRRP